MGLEVGAQLLRVAQEVQALLEAVHVARREAEPGGAQALELAGHIEVLEEGGQPRGLVHRELDLDLVPGVLGGVAVQAHRLDHGAAVLHRGGDDVLLGDLDPAVADVQGHAHVAPLEVLEGVLELVPGQRRGVRLGDAGGDVGDHVARIQGEHHEAGLEAPVDALGGLDVVAVGAEAAVPAGFHQAEDRVVHHGLGAAAQAVHLADRLLGEDGHHAGALGGEGTRLAGGREARAVAGADGGAVTADLLRAQSREGGLQRLGVRGGQGAGEHVAVTGRCGLALEGGQSRRRGGDELERAGGAVVADARLEGVVAQGHGVLRSGWVRDRRCPGGRIAEYRKRLHRCRLQGSR